MQNGLFLNYIELPKEQNNKCLVLSTANYMGTNSKLLAVLCQARVTTVKIICSSTDLVTPREIFVAPSEDARYRNLGCTLGWSVYGILSFGCLQERDGVNKMIIYTIKPSSGSCKNPFDTACRFSAEGPKLVDIGGRSVQYSFIGSCSANSLSDMFVLLVRDGDLRVYAIQYQYIMSYQPEFEIVWGVTDIKHDRRGIACILSCTATSVYYILIEIAGGAHLLYSCVQSDILVPHPTCTVRGLRLESGVGIRSFEMIHNTIAYNVIRRVGGVYSLWLGFNDINGGMVGSVKLVAEFTDRKHLIPVLHCLDASCAVVRQRDGNSMYIYDLKGVIKQLYRIQNDLPLFLRIYVECDFIYPEASTRPGLHYGNIFPSDNIIYRNIGSISKVMLLSDENKLSASIYYIDSIVTQAVNYYFDLKFDGTVRAWPTFLVAKLKQLRPDDLDNQISLLALFTSLAYSIQVFAGIRELEFQIASGSVAIIKTVPYETYGVNIQGDNGNIIVVNAAKQDDEKGTITMHTNILVSLAATHSTPSGVKSDCTVLTAGVVNGCWQQWATYIMGLDCSLVSKNVGCDIPYIYNDQKTGLYFLLPILLQDYEQFYLGVRSLLSYAAPEESKLKKYNSLYGGDKMDVVVHQKISEMEEVIKNLVASKRFAYFYNGRPSVNGECDFDTALANQRAFRDNSYYTVICQGTVNEDRQGTAGSLYNHGTEPWIHVLFHELTHAKLNTVDKYVDGGPAYYGIEACCKYSDIIKNTMGVPGAEAGKQVLIADCITYAAVLPYLDIEAPSCMPSSSTRHMDEESYNYKSKKEEDMKILSQNITCALNVVITNSDVMMTYHLINSLPYQIIVPVAATLSAGLKHNHLTITGPSSYSCSQDHGQDTNNDVVINPGNAISTSISLMEACNFGMEWAPPGRYTVTMNNYARVTVVDPMEVSASDNIAYTHLYCATIIEILAGKAPVDGVSGNDL